MALQESNPKRFIDMFRGDDIYSLAFKRFYQGKNIASDVSYWEQMQVFESSTDARRAMIDYARVKNQFVLDRSIYHKDTIDCIDTYINHVRFSYERRMHQIDRDEIERLDVTRSLHHRNAAKKIAEEHGIENEELARVLVRLLLIDQGVEPF